MRPMCSACDRSCWFHCAGVVAQVLPTQLLLPDATCLVAGSRTRVGDTMAGAQMCRLKFRSTAVSRLAHCTQVKRGAPSAPLSTRARCRWSSRSLRQVASSSQDCMQGQPAGSAQPQWVALPGETVHGQQPLGMGMWLVLEGAQRGVTVSVKGRRSAASHPLSSPCRRRQHAYSVLQAGWLQSCCLAMWKCGHRGAHMAGARMRAGAVHACHAHAHTHTHKVWMVPWWRQQPGARVTTCWCCSSWCQEVRQCMLGWRGRGAHPLLCTLGLHESACTRVYTRHV